jgi:hypothetical protein
MLLVALLASRSNSDEHAHYKQSLFVLFCVFALILVPSFVIWVKALQAIGMHRAHINNAITIILTALPLIDARRHENLLFEMKPICDKLMLALIIFISFSLAIYPYVFQVVPLVWSVYFFVMPAAFRCIADKPKSS